VIKLIVLMSDLILVSQIEEVGVEIGEPDCKLIEPFVYNSDETLTPWLLNHSNDNTFMISSDKILTIAEPKPTILEKYQNLIK